MNDGNRKENVTWKENMHCLKLNRAHSISFNSSVLASISGVEFLKTVSNFRRWERNLLSHVAHKTWNKEVFASKSCGDNKEMYNVFLKRAETVSHYWRFHCRRRHRCLSSLLSALGSLACQVSSLSVAAEASHESAWATKGFIAGWPRASLMWTAKKGN